MREVIINEPVVELFKILKFEGIAESGAQAKLFIDEGYVKVNGEFEHQKRKKIVSGDLIEVGDDRIKIIFNDKV